MMEPKDWRQRSLAAQALAREVGVIAKRRFLDRSSFSVKFKGRQDFLTEVDVEVERLIAARLQEAFPDDGMIGEEGAGRVAKDGFPTWVVDPIDGTANFARGAPHWCVSIACILGKQIEIGAIYQPMLDELFFARKGEGAFVNGIAMHPSAAQDLGESAVEIGWNARAHPERYLALVKRVVDTGATVARGGSGALGLAWVAAGRRDGYCEHFINSWDCLAALLMISEAGGYCSNFLAGDALTKGGSVIAATPGIKAALIEAAAIEGIVL
jgi:myo-inositol-1(or 4)-monophosphatase